MSKGAEQAAGGEMYRMLRELGARAQHSYAAVREPHELVVAQRFVRGLPRSVDGARALHDETATTLDTPELAMLLRDARCLAKHWHPNIGRIRHVDLVGSELTIASELIDGTTLADLFEAGSAERTGARDPLLALPVLVRILLDVLAGLHALHGLRDGMNAPLGAIHGELCPANIVVGKDGVARIVNVLRSRPVKVMLGSEGVGYAAPEALDLGGTDDPRADVHAVGVILWEALAARRLYDEIDPTRVLSLQRESELSPPPIHPSSPFARLADVAMQALAFDPALRFRSASEMAAELRKIAGSRLASGSAVAARVVDLTGDDIRARRALLDPATSGVQRRSTEQSEVATVAPAQPLVDALADVDDTREHAAAVADEVQEPSGVVAPTLEVKAGEDLADYELDDDEELPGPRGSSPALDPESVFALEAFPVAKVAISPLAPRLAMPRLDSPRATAPTTVDGDASARRALAQGASPCVITSATPLAAQAPRFPPPPPRSEPRLDATPASAPIARTSPELPAARTSDDPRAAWPAAGSAGMRSSSAETPGELVVPVGAPDLDEASPGRRRRATALFMLAAAVVVLAASASVAVRALPSRGQAAAVGLHGSDAPPTSPAVAPPPAIEALPAAANDAAIAIAPVAPRPSATPSASTTPSATTTAAPARAPAASSPPAAKPKRSVYDPDGIF